VASRPATCLRRYPLSHVMQLEKSEYDPSEGYFEVGARILSPAIPKRNSVEVASTQLSDRCLRRIWMDDNSFEKHIFPLLTLSNERHFVC